MDISERYFRTMRALLLILLLLAVIIGWLSRRQCGRLVNGILGAASDSLSGEP
jgi:hypothetical protein